MHKKTVLITGSSRGIGEAISYAFAKEKYNIVINASRSCDELNKVETNLKSMGCEVLSFLGDVSDYSSCEKLFKEIENMFGGVDILINNAGISHIGLFSDTDTRIWNNILSVNLNSVLNCSHLSLKYMIQKKSGCIINISSVWGNVGASCEVIYSTSKGAVNAFTKALAKEVGPSNIRVNAIACGVIDTKMNSCFTKEEKQSLIDEISLSRFGTPWDVAKFALTLASDNASYINGQVITLDGGML